MSLSATPSTTVPSDSANATRMTRRAGRRAASPRAPTRPSLTGLPERMRLDPFPLSTYAVLYFLFRLIRRWKSAPTNHAFLQPYHLSFVPRVYHVCSCPPPRIDDSLWLVCVRCKRYDSRADSKPASWIPATTSPVVIQHTLRTRPSKPHPTICFHRSLRFASIRHRHA
jgi:hypothetical protein